ncbi:MAG: urease accessory protein UreD [Photobacterium frigidiphilum]|uniref:urease accessory protein UreD n=1 Tax=Photobacterium frigidiphilum TaxID=264736 RepID=UPI0030024727
MTTISAIKAKPLSETLEAEEGWCAKLSLGYTHRGDKTVLKHKKQLGPLAVQRPLYPEGDICHTYLLHPPGGVVGGDKLLISTIAHQDAKTLITTPGATKFYRSAGPYAYQKQQLTVEADAVLEWLPQENIYFPEANVRLDTEITVQPGGRFIGWEMHCFGRPALNEGFNKGSIVGCTQLKMGDELVLAEQLNVQGGDQHQSCAGLRDYSMLGTMMITTSDDDLLKVVQSLLYDYQVYADDEDADRASINAGVGFDSALLAGVTLTDGVMTIRVMSHGTEPMLALFTQIWQSVRLNWFGYTPFAPRIWAT